MPIRITKFTAAALLFLFIGLISFNACQKGDSPQIVEQNFELQQLDNGTFSKQIVLGKQAKMHLQIKTKDEKRIVDISSGISFKPIFSIGEKNDLPAQKNEKTSANFDKKTPIEIEILDVDLPEGALGYTLTVNAMQNDTGVVYLMTNTAGNLRHVQLTNNGNSPLHIKNDFSTCDYQDVFFLLQDWLQIEPTWVYNGFVNFQNVGLNRLAIAYEKHVDQFNISYALPGTCVDTDGVCNTTDEPCNTDEENNLLPNFTLQKMSKFAASGQSPALRKMTSLYLQNKGLIHKIYNENPDLQATLKELINKNNFLLINAFANDFTKIEAKHLDSVRALLDLFDAKLEDTSFSREVKELRKSLKNLEGKEFKTGMSGLSF